VLGLLKMMKIEKLLSCVRSKKNGDERWDADGWAVNSVATNVDGGSGGYHQWVSIEKEEPIWSLSLSLSLSLISSLSNLFPISGFFRYFFHSFFLISLNLFNFFLCAYFLHAEGQAPFIPFFIFYSSLSFFFFPTIFNTFFFLFNFIYHYPLIS
jgi:hypothetical protein